MSGIHVIVTFETRPELASSFASLLERVKVDLPQVNGCRGVQIFAGTGDVPVFTLLEEWDSAELHQAHIAGVVASGAWGAIAAHLARDPQSHYYTRH